MLAELPHGFSRTQHLGSKQYETEYDWDTPYGADAQPAIIIHSPEDDTQRVHQASIRLH